MVEHSRAVIGTDRRRAARCEQSAHRGGRRLRAQIAPLTGRARPVAGSVHEPGLGKVLRRKALIPGTPLHGRRQPQRQFDGHLGKPVNTRLCEHGGDDTADRGRSAIDVVVIRKNGFHRLVGRKRANRSIDSP